MYVIWASGGAQHAVPVQKQIPRCLSGKRDLYPCPLQYPPAVEEVSPAGMLVTDTFSPLERLHFPVRRSV